MNDVKSTLNQGEVFGVLLVPLSDKTLIEELTSIGTFAIAAFRERELGLEVTRNGHTNSVDFRGRPLPFTDLAGLAYEHGDNAVDFVQSELIDFPGGVPCRRCSSPLHPDDIRWLFNCASARFHRFVRAAATAQEQLSSLRKQYAQCQSDFKELEDFYQIQSAPKCIKVWDEPVEGDVIGPFEADEKLQFVHRIPVQSLGVIQIHVFLQEVSCNADCLKLRLIGVETGKMLQEWTVRDAPSGWYPLCLKNGLSAFALTLELVIEWVSEASTWRLGGSGPQLRPTVTSPPLGGLHQRGIAVRVFVGLPGVAAALHPQAVDATTATKARVCLSGELLAHAVALTPPPADIHYTLIGYIHDLRGLLIHPIEAGISVAGLGGICPIGATRLRIGLRHAKRGGAPFLFAARVGKWVRPSDGWQIYAGTFTDRSTRLLVSEGDWIRIDDGISCVVQIVLDSQAVGEETVQLATLPAVAGYSTDAWAVVEFVEFEFS